MSGILTVTLNPALDLTTGVDRLVGGRKLRCDLPRQDAGGGGVNVSRAIAKLGRTSTAFVAVGGVTGAAHRTLLEAEGIDVVFFGIGGDTRQSFAVHERATGEQYRFVLPGPTWSAAVFAACLDALAAHLQPDGVVVVSGSAPPGLPDDAYLALAERATQAGARAVVDTSGRTLAQTLQRHESPLHAVVMDEHEAREQIGNADLTVDGVRAWAGGLVAAGTVQVAVVTLGAVGAIGVTSREAWLVSPPEVLVGSTVGAGDSFVAAFSLGLVEDWPIGDALVYAMAAATSAVTTPATELCKRVDVEVFRRSVRVTRL